MSLAQPKPLHLLLIDDNKDLCESLKYFFAAAGMHTDIALDGSTALSLLKDGQLPDAILLDLMMPTMNGWEFLAEMDRRHIPPIPVLLWSDYAELPVDAPRERVIGTVSKKASPTVVIATIREALGKKGDS